MSVRKSSHQDCGPCYLHPLSYIRFFYTLLFCRKIRSRYDRCFPQQVRPQTTIRGHKGRNSTRTRFRGFLVLESRCRDFLVLESRCRGFLSSEKTPWNHDIVAYLSPFLDAVVFWSWNLDVVFFGLGVPMSYMCLHGLVFIIIMKTKKSRTLMSIMLLKNILIVQIYANLSA